MDLTYNRGVNKRVLLIVLDGFGEGKEYPGNAITRARTKILPQLRSQYPVTFLEASGHAVGVPKGVQGGSEVGHFTMGAGRIVFQTLEEINHQILNGDFFKNKVLLTAFEHVKKDPDATLHLLGMISDQGVHADVRHLLALITLAKQEKVKRIAIHAITDGRDVPMQSVKKYIEQIQKEIKSNSFEDSAFIATLIGRYYAMDRDSNWSRLQVAYDLLVEGKGQIETDPIKAIENAYISGANNDYYLPPIRIKEAPIRSRDTVIFFNFRTDRARQLAWAFTGENDDKIQLRQSLHERPRPYFLCFGDYSKKAPVVFPTPVIINNLASVISQAGKKQFRIAETEKYAHVTYFFNSQIEAPYPGESRLMINSPKCPSYAEKPSMSAREITKTLITILREEQQDLIVCNYANLDLVGHSGNFNAAIQAVEVIDECLGNIIPEARTHHYTIIITGDHGNVEYMLYDDGTPCPSHTKNPVPCILCDDDRVLTVQKDTKDTLLRSDEGLASIAPTILEIMGIPKPPEMTANSLLTFLT